MIKKIIAFQKLLFQGFGTPDRNRGVWIVFLIAFVMSVVTGILQMAVSDFFWFVAPLFIWAQMGSILNSNNKLSRSLPVSDKFAVANMLFIAPLITALIILWTLIAMIVMIFIARLCFADNTVSLSEIYSWFEGADIWKMGFVSCICCGLWCWMGFAAFHKDRRVRMLIVTLVSVTVFGALVFAFAVIRRESGYHGKLGVGDFLELSNRLVMLVCACIFMVGSAVFAWRRSLKLYRTDVKGQVRCTKKEEEIYDINGGRSQSVIRSGELSGVKKILAVVCSLAVVAAAFVFEKLSNIS